MFSSVTSHLNSVSHDLPLFTFHLTLASKFLGTYTVLWCHLEFHYHLWCLSMLQRVFRHGLCSIQLSTKQSDPHVSILSLILWSLLLSLVAHLCDNQGVPFGPAGFLSFSVNLWSHLGEQKDFSVFCSWERCSGVASILCNPYAPTSTSTVL